jgi:hypothetical protein
MAQTYEPGDKVEVVSGPGAGRKGTVVNNFGNVHGDDLTDGALVQLDDRLSSNDPVAGQRRVGREFRSSMLRRA